LYEVQKAAAQRFRHVSPGDKLGKYEVIRQIAVGGMAEIYLARTLGIEGFEKLVVIKRILPQYVSNASFVDMFLNEARLAATLHHPNVAQVYDIGVDSGDYFFAMEYVHGEDLDHMSVASEEQGVPISLDAALTLVAGLCAGLHYAHDKVGTDGRPLLIVHRDVSPSNVLVSYDGAVKLVDFGIARASSRPGTTQGGLKGKIAYMSPEQCRAKGQLDRRSDIYAVGTILYQLTTGRMPFAGETEYQVLNQIVNEDAPPPSTIVDGYPAALEHVVLRALARDPAKRFATARDMQAAVEDFAHETRLRVSPLVLARLMGTLFPARLEEWDQAKSQGAFFVEQQVVRTLIESGRTPQRGEDTSRGLAAAAVGDDETTINANRSQMQFLQDTATNVSSIAETERSHVGDVPAPPPLPHTPPPIPSTPRPQMYPVMGGGTLVSSSGVGPSIGVVESQVTSQYEVTERVRVPVHRHPSPTSFVRTSRGRSTWLAVAGLLVVAGGAAAFVVARGGSRAAVSPAASTPVEVEAPEPAPAAPIADTPAPAPEPSAAPAIEPEPEAAPAEEPARVEPAPEVAPSVAHAPRPAAPKASKPTKRAKPKAKAEPKPAGGNWNADSPFMPVRTEKK
jgi:tRNA A-37 threonylcarbamoyl transferase component Bud32